MPETPNLRSLPEEQRVAFYGVLFAMADADGVICKDELTVLFENLDTEGLSTEASRTVRSYVLDPPDLGACLSRLTDADEALRYGVMIQLVEVALADDIIEPEEQQALDYAAQRLGVSGAQLEQVVTFVREARRIRARGLDDDEAAEALKHATAGLTAVGVPIAAVYFSGTVVGLSAAGITSGLAALGLGFGMVPGIGIAVLIGTATFMGVKWLLGRNKATKEQQLAADRERRAQLVVQNLQHTINDLVDRITELQAKADQADANAEAIRALNARLRALKQVLARRRDAMAG